MKNGTTTTVAVVKDSEGTTFTFNGLDDGDYVLTETKTPAGYNSIKPITFTVTANHTITWEGEDRDTILTSLSGNAASGEITFTPTDDKSELDTNVVKQAGFLPAGDWWHGHHRAVRCRCRPGDRGRRVLRSQEEERSLSELV